MTSRISFSKILKEDFRRRVWMLVLSCLAAFITMPVAFLLGNRNYSNSVSNQYLQESYIEFFHSYGAVFQGIVLGVGALIVAVWGFRHLYSRKMVDLYHAVPATRERLFLATYVNGLLIWLLPMLTATLITLLIALGNLWTHNSYTSASENLLLSWPIITAAVKLIVVSVFAFLAVYHFALICVMFSGNVPNALLSILVLGCSVGAFYLIFTTMRSTFLDTYVESVLAIDQVLWASPLIAPFRLMADFAQTGAGALFWSLGKSEIHSPFLFRILSFLLTGINFFLALFLYKKRPSELAEHGIDHKYAQILMRFCTGLLAALFGSLIFLWLVNKNAFAWQVFGLLFCGTLALGVLDIILHMNFKAFFQHKLQMVLCLSLGLFLLSSHYFDLTGFDHRLPAKEKILDASITLSHYRDDSSGATFEGDVLTSVKYNTYKSYSDLDALYPLLEELASKSRPNEYNVGNISVCLETPSGPFYRRYRIKEQDKELLRPIVESPEYLEATYPLSMGLVPQPREINVESRITQSHYTTSDLAQITEILSAYQSDFQANRKLEQLNTGLEVGRLEVAYPYVYNGETTPKNYYFSFTIYSHYTETIDKIHAYYPDLVFDKDSLTVSSLEIYPAEIDTQMLFGLTHEDFGITEDIPWVDAITITDAAELQELLPYLIAGDMQQGMFNCTPMHYLGHAQLNSGYTTTFYVPENLVPLPITPSIQEALHE